ncbi:family A G protein-coupled receptor-like protein [Dentipellis sp. KUC8613]|nr:family A G protein-coupled receptor-like protein [Dentipellis sp. KUC8613]
MPNSVQVNPPAAQLHISAHGADWLWSVFAVYAVVLLFTLMWSFIQPRGQRAFHHIALVILVVGTIAYFTMASNLGQAAVTAEFSRSHTPPITRGIFFARYIMWALDLSLITLSVLLGTGATLSEIFVTIVMNLVWIVLLLFGAIVHSSYKWGYYTMSVCSIFYVMFQINFLSLRSSLLPNRRSSVGGASFITFFWLMYPLIWAFADGGNVISPTGEAVWYGVVDLLTMPVFVMTHLWGARGVDYDSLGFSSGKTTDFSGARAATTAPAAPREKVDPAPAAV